MSNHTQTDIRNILRNPMARPAATYRFKVIALQNNDVSFKDMAGELHVATLVDNNSDLTLEQQYEGNMDNLFLVVDIAGNYFFTSRTSNTHFWPNFY